MSFSLVDSAAPGVYATHRRYYSGKGGWHMLSMGPLAKLVRAYTGAIGTDRFFELM